MRNSNTFPAVRGASVFSLAIALALPALTPVAAYAQGVDDGEIEEVTVYGVRQSLDNAADIKRASDTIVDAITA